MSSGTQASSPSTPNFKPIFEKALKEYKKKTGKDLIAHPLAVQIKDCKSPEAILAVLEGRANELNEARSGEERLVKWLNPTVNIITALSATLGQGAGLIFPPTTIIFSGIGILLVAAKDTVANRDVLIKLFGRIESFFERLKIYTKVTPSPAVTDELAKTMAEVLSILAIATKGIKERQIKIFLKKVAGMNELEDALRRFGELEQREILTGIAQVSSDATVLKGDAKETKAMVKEIANRMDAGDWKEMLLNLERWLSPADPSTNYNIGLRDLHKETATWFLEGPIFQEWYSSGSLLWIYGKPGSGKSILCSAIIQRILSLSEGGKQSVAYFYFDFRDDNKKHRHNLLSSLIVQFATHSIPCCDITSRIYSAHGNGTQQPSDEVLINCLMSMLSATGQLPIYLIVDALDESPNISGVRSPRERVLSLINDLVNLHLPNLRICATSRPEVDIGIRLEHLISCRVSLHDQAGHKEDIAKYISSEVDFIANNKRWREDDKKMVIETLSTKADGMFRWVFCQLEMLRLCLRSNIRRFLNGLPKSLDDTYERILKGIPEENRSHVHRMLQCLAVAFRPLSVNELAAILNSDHDVIEGEIPVLDVDFGSEDQEQELLSACPSLITIVGSRGSRVVQFSHFSVKEFLTSNRLAASSEDISTYHILPDAAHTTFARASLGFLLRLDGRVIGRIAMNIPLAMYAAEYWVSHAHIGNVSSHVMGTMKTLFNPDKPHFAVWLRIYNIDNYGFARSTAKPLYVSALCGFYDLVEHLVKTHPQDVNAFGGRQEFPLIAALSRGHLRVADLLVQHGADVSIQGTGKQVPLHQAVKWPDDLAVGAVQFLLEHHADVNAPDGHKTTALHSVSYFINLKMVRMLLDLGANVNAQDDRDRTPLHQVLDDVDEDNAWDNEGFLEVAKLLMERGADVNALNKRHETPLHRASRLLLLKMAWILLKRGADLKVENREGKIPFELARERIRKEMERSPSEYSTRRAYRAQGVALMGLLSAY